MSTPFKARDRVSAIFTNRRGDERVFFGMISEDELEFYEKIIVQWDDERRMSDDPIDKRRLSFVSRPQVTGE